MITIEKFCGTSLSNGTIIFGWFSIFYSIFTAVASFFTADLMAIIWYTIIGVGTGILLLIAVKRSLHTLLLPWLGVNAFHIVIVTPLALIMIIWKYLSEPGFLLGCIIYLAFITLVICYGWVGVFSFYHLLKREKQNGLSASAGGRV